MTMTTVSVLLLIYSKEETTTQQHLPFCQCKHEDAILRLNMW